MLTEKLFLLQVDQNGYPTTDVGYALTQAYAYRKWWDKSPLPIGMINTTSESLKAYSLLVTDVQTKENMIPVGSIEFIESWLGRHIEPRNVPLQLREHRYSGREIRDGNIAELQEFCQSHSINVNSMYVKSLNRVKDELIPAIDIGHLPHKIKSLEGHSFQFSTPLPRIYSEWRVFVWRNHILGCQCYLNTADPIWMPRQPNYEAVQEMVNAYTESPTAYTLDIAVCESNTDAASATYVVECHNFLACGLYGFDDPIHLMSMLASAWKEEVNGVF